MKKNRNSRFWIVLFYLGFTFCNISVSQARPNSSHQPTAVVVGTVFCDSCFQQGFSKANHFIPGATVAVKCADSGKRSSFYKKVKTNQHGEFSVHLPFLVDKHAKEIQGCSVKLVSSSEPNCAVASTTTSSPFRLKSTKEGTHIFSAGSFTFKPVKQPKLCNKKPSIRITNEKTTHVQKSFPTPRAIKFSPPIQDSPSTSKDPTFSPLIQDSPSSFLTIKQGLLPPFLDPKISPAIQDPLSMPKDPTFSPPIQVSPSTPNDPTFLPRIQDSPSSFGTTKQGWLPPLPTLPPLPQLPPLPPLPWFPPTLLPPPPMSPPLTFPSPPTSPRLTFPSPATSPPLTFPPFIPPPTPGLIPFLPPPPPQPLPLPAPPSPLFPPFPFQPMFGFPGVPPAATSSPKKEKNSP